MSESGIFKMLKYKTNNKIKFDFPKQQTETIHIMVEKLLEVIYESYKRKSCPCSLKRHQTIKFINTICEVPDPHSYNNYLKCALKQLNHYFLQGKSDDIQNFRKMIVYDLKTYHDFIKYHYSRSIIEEKETNLKKELINESIKTKLEKKYQIDMRKKYSFVLTETLLKKILGVESNSKTSLNIGDDGKVCDIETTVKLGYAMLNLEEVIILKKMLHRISQISLLNELESNFLRYIWLLHCKDNNVLVEENINTFYFLMEHTLLVNVTPIVEMTIEEEVCDYLLEMRKDSHIINIKRLCKHNINLYFKLRTLLYELYCLSFCNVNILKFCEIIL